MEYVSDGRMRATSISFENQKMNSTQSKEQMLGENVSIFVKFETNREDGNCLSLLENEHQIFFL